MFQNRQSIKSPSERLLTRGHFWRDEWQGGTFGETIDKGELWERQLIDKGGVLARLNNTSTTLLTMLLLLVNHCSRPSHIIYAFYLFLSRLIDGGTFWERTALFDTVKMLHLNSTSMFLYCTYCSSCCYLSNLTVYNVLCTNWFHTSYVPFDAVIAAC